MFLKRLESIGFKSFAERIDLEFVPGVTAIVGPNGSGKSNIIDAVRWVLGEQSARSLRGSKMEDVIFQGSTTRKALNVADVTLTLDNSTQTLPLAFDEVSVTRRVYRSGESEFYINQEACRLKDIIDLFLDSGLGREAFSIISQGKVEEVLSSKPEERRAIFEEAAGVLKYKQRKIKSEYKLKETEDNLSRIKDIYYEIEQQIEPLRIQKKTAEKFLDLKEQLKQEEIALMVTEIEQLHTKWTKTSETVKEQQFKELKWQADNKKLEDFIEEKRHELAEIDKEIENYQEQLLETTKEIERLQTKNEVLIERSKHVGETKTKLNERKADLAVKQSQIEQLLLEEQKVLQELTQEKKSLQQEKSALQQMIDEDPDKLASSIEHLKADYIEMLNKQAANNNALQSINLQRKQLSEKEKRIQEKQKNKQQPLNNLATKKREKQSEIELQTEELTKYEKALEQYDTEKNHNTTALNQAVEQYNLVARELAKTKSRQEMLHEMKTDFQGFYSGARHVLKASEKKELDSIQGAIIQLIDIPKQYLQAIETALGGNAQHIITKDENSARKAIQLLKDKKLGRATFLPMSTIKPRVIPTEMLRNIEQHKDFIGIAADLISCNPKFSNIMHHVMGNVIIARHLKAANDIAKIIKNRYRIVTLEGDIVNPGGAMTGGASKRKNQSLFTREQELNQLNEALKKLRGKERQLQEQIQEKKRNIESIDSYMKDTQEISNTTNEKYENNLTTLQQIDKEYELILQELKSYELDERAVHEEFVDCVEKTKVMEDKQDALQKELQQLNEQIDHETNKQSNYSKHIETSKNELHNLELNLTRLAERISRGTNETNRLMSELDELKESEKNTEEELQQIIELENTENVQVQLTIEMAEKENHQTSLTETIAKRREERLNCTKDVDAQNREYKQAVKQLNEFNKMMQAKEIEANRLEVSLHNALQALQDEYKITYEKACQDYIKSSNISSSRENVAKLKQSIANLGNVNLAAIEEFEQVYERYAFLSEQQSDLLEAKATLHQVIAEMDEEMEKLFEETFLAIQEQFNHVFNELFGGGYAELRMTNPEELLETGIDIIAEPPGKKLKHLSLLSGGEKALTAIALLFAILRVRPVPFCILDEVEAALDEANVQRFARFLHEYADETQFIVITHRKGTMEEADVLYGVTMQESGVSRLVSVRLDNKKELISQE